MLVPDFPCQDDKSYINSGCPMAYSLMSESFRFGLANMGRFLCNTFWEGGLGVSPKLYPVLRQKKS